MRTNDQPGIDCLTDGHLFIDWWQQGAFLARQKTDAPPPNQHGITACWCLWCGTAVYDGSKVNPNTPT
jgi:hypothetical protein